MARSTPTSAPAVLDVATGAVVACARAAERVARPAARWMRPVVGTARVLGTALAPAAATDAVTALERQGRGARDRLARRAQGFLDLVVPAVMAEILDRIDLTTLVLRRVDLDRVAAGLDLDAAAARLDIGKILDRIDLNELIEQRVDIDRVAAGIDLDGIAARIDVDAVAARLDIDRVMGRVDLIGLAEYVVDGIDLPRIIRESTGSVASEGLREVRTRSMEADQALAHLVDRMLLRRGSGRNRAGWNGAQNPPEAGDLGAD